MKIVMGRKTDITSNEKHDIAKLLRDGNKILENVKKKKLSRDH